MTMECKRKQCKRKSSKGYQRRPLIIDRTLEGGEEIEPSCMKDEQLSSHLETYLNSCNEILKVDKNAQWERKGTYGKQHMG